MFDEYESLRVGYVREKVQADKYRDLARIAADDDTRARLEKWESIYRTAAKDYERLLTERGQHV